MENQLSQAIDTKTKRFVCVMNYLSHDFSLLGDIAEKKIFECFLSLWLEVSSGRKWVAVKTSVNLRCKTNFKKFLNSETAEQE